MKKKTKNILLFLSTLGLIDSIYLSLPYFTNTTTYCVASDVISCDLVLNSEYSKLFLDIPNSLLGIFYYLILVIMFIFWDRIILKIKNLLKLSIFITFLSSLLYTYFIYLQSFIIKSYCPYCILSAIITFTIYALLLKIYLKK